MYRDAYQRGLLTIFYSCGSKPLNIWDTYTQDGYISKLLDEDIRSTVLEIGGTNVSTTYMICPKGKQVLGITMPFLVMIIKNVKKYFSFEVTILDDTGTRRRFRVSNFQSTTQILPLCTVMPIALSEGWNQVQFNMSDFCRRAYQKQFVEVQKFKINANIRVRRIYFADRIFPEDQLPAEYKLYIPLKQRPQDKNKTKSDEKFGETEKEKTELKQKDYTLKSTSKVIKPVSVIKAVSQEKILSRAGSVVNKSSAEVLAEGEMVAGESVAQGKEPVAQAEEQVAQDQEPAVEVDKAPDDNDAAISVATAEAATEAVPEKVQSSEAQTQTDSVTIKEDVPVEDKTTNTQRDEESKSVSDIQPIAE